MEANWRRRFRAPMITLPTWARDEPERAMYLSNAHGKYEWYAWDRRAGTHRQVTDRPQGTMSASIDPTGEWIWWFDDSSGNELGTWVRERFDGEGDRDVLDLRPGYAEGLALGREVAIVGSAFAGVHSVHVAPHGERPMPLYEHREAVGVGGLSRDEELVALAHSEHGDSRNRALRVIDLDGGTVAELWDGPGKGLAPGGWARQHGDRRMLVHHEREGIQRPAIWEPESGSFDDLDVDLPGEVGASWYPDGTALLLTHLWRGRTELHRLDLATRERERIDIGAGIVAGARIRPDGELWYGITRSSSPQVVHCGDEVLRPPGEPAPGGVAYSDLQVGDVHAFLAEPDSPRPHATLFHVHGGPSGVDVDAFAPGVQAWVDHGVAVVMVNYRGSAGYGKAWRDAIVGKPGILELEDIAAVREHVVAEGIADPERIVLAGGSWGGYLTLLGLGRQPGLWSLGISQVPLADLVNHYAQQSVPLQAYWRALFGGTPEEIPEVLEEISPINFVDNVAAPLFLLTGDNDPRCPIGQVLNYVSKMEELGKEIDLYRYDAGHGSLVTEERIHQMEMQLAYVSKRLGTLAPQ